MRTKLLPLLLIALAGCGRSSGTTPDAQAPEAGGPLKVEVVHPEKKTVRYAIEQPGRIEAFEETPLHVKISGYVEKINVDIGDAVTGPRVDAEGKLTKPGQVLAELWAPELVEALNQKKAREKLASATVVEAESALKAAAASIEAARAQIREAEAGCDRTEADRVRWTSEHARIARLVKERAVDEQLLDESLNRRKSAEAACRELDARIKSLQAALAESEARRDEARAKLGVAKANQGVAQADRRQAQVLVDYRTVRAPFDGIVTVRNIDTGHFLMPDKNGASSVLFVVERHDPVRVFVDVPEMDAAFINDKTPARVRVQALGNAEIKGTVTRTARRLDHRSHTLRTEIDLPNADGTLRPGMYAYASLKVAREDVVTLPTSAVAVEGNDAFCYFVKDGKALRTPIRSAPARAGKIVITSHFRDAGGVWQRWSGQEAIVASILPELHNGSKVATASKD